MSLVDLMYLCFAIVIFWSKEKVMSYIVWGKLQDVKYIIKRVEITSAYDLLSLVPCDRLEMLIVVAS